MQSRIKRLVASLSITALSVLVAGIILFGMMVYGIGMGAFGSHEYGIYEKYSAVALYSSVLGIPLSLVTGFVAYHLKSLLGYWVSLIIHLVPLAIFMMGMAQLA